MSEKITDLEKFATQNILRPYQELLIDAGYNMKEFTIDTMLFLFRKHPEWRELVIERILDIGFRFPAYIKHPLVEYIKERALQRIVNKEKGK